MFARRATSDLAELDRIETLVRARYGLPDDALVLVTEEDGTLPGEPARSTTVLFWTDRDRRHRLRVFRPAAEVGAGDLPPGWLRGALTDMGDIECC